jgi:photosystem II stability/assembly factor-like uncharacterized protein
MRKFWLFLFLIGFSAWAFGAWEAIGPYGGSLSSFAAAANESALYVTSANTPAKVMKSTDGGANWFNVTPINDYVYSLAVDPTNANVVYAGALSYVYKSTDAGASWTGVLLPGYYAYSMAINPSNPSIVYASGYYYNGSASVVACFKSTNGGTSWTTAQLSTISGMGYCVTLDPSSPANVYVSGYYYDTDYHPCVYKSTNDGTSFTEISSGFPASAYYVMSLKVHPTTGTTIYAGTYNAGIFRSTNGGASWTGVDTSWKFIASLSAAPIAPNVAYAGGDTLIYKTTNAGASWFPVAPGFGGQTKSTRTVYASRISTNLVVTTDSKGFYKSTNGGASWFESNHGITIAAVAALSTAPSAPSTVYTEYEGVGVYRSSNCGTTWNLLPTPLTCGSICEFAVHRTDPNNVLGLEGLG